MGPGLEKAPTGIPGLDQITGGGLPRGRVSLVAGSAGAGKTLLGLEFLVGGARKYGEPGILVSFEESAEKVALNVRSLGFDLDELEREGKLEVIAFQVDPTDMVAAGAFNLEPIFLILDDAIQRLGARRVVLDTMEMLYGAFGDDTTIRAELNRLARWLEERNVTAVVTGERGEKSVTRHGIEEYVTDCVILLDHRVTEEISTRRLRVLKYRGTVHGTNEFPFLISAQGFVVLPITSIVLDYPASDERMSTGVGRLDHMLGGGVFRGSTTLVTGVAGTGKTSLGAHMVDAACERNEQALWILFEESPAQVLRNMRSLGLDLQRWVDAGLLRIWAAQPSAFGLEAHLAALAQLMEDVVPSVVVLDGIGGLGLGVSGQEVGSMVARQIDLLKSSACTTMVTSRGREDEPSTVSISSLVDTWLLLRNVETNGERNRLLFVLKSRGTAHSNQVREFVLTDHGVELVEVYVGPAGVLAGSARLAQQAVERDAELRRADDLEQHLRGLRSSISERQAHLIAARDQLIAEQTEMDRIDSRERREVADTEADRASMASQRWADAAPDPDEAPGRRWARLAPDNGGKR
jgi:circadian clock protein KaiC